eukprot:1194321-Amphidinium_carterae.1
MQSVPGGKQLPQGACFTPLALNDSGSRQGTLLIYTTDAVWKTDSTTVGALSRFGCVLDTVAIWQLQIHQSAVLFVATESPCEVPVGTPVCPNGHLV